MSAVAEVMGMLAEQILGSEGNATLMPCLAGNGSLDAQPGMISRSENRYPLCHSHLVAAC